MIQRIVICWDNSPPARRAFDTALDIARRYDAEITAVSVAYAPAHAETEDDRIESVNAARRYLAETFESLRDRGDRIGIPVEHVVLEGRHPPADISEFVTEHAADLIVVGHHRHRRAGRFLLQGVVEHLLDQTDAPVLVVTQRNGG